MAQYRFFLASSLEKVMPGRMPEIMAEGATLSAWPGTRAAVQLVYWADLAAEGCWIPEFAVEVSGSPAAVTLRRVRLMPSEYPCPPISDDDYISKAPGLFPDLLEPMDAPVFTPLHHQYRSIWLTFPIPEDCAGGNYPITVTVRGAAGENMTVRHTFTLRIAAQPLLPQELLHTEWFHADCLASFYGVGVWSEAHWCIVEHFLTAAARDYGINTILTPIFTPPLDTAVGGERLTTQLLDVARDGGSWRFSFQKLKRWAGICKKAGITHLEISHFFTQWGAAAAPKIVATVDGAERRVFGWDTPAAGAEYRAFLTALLPALLNALAECGYDRAHLFFHISDEPGGTQVDAYRAAKAQVADLLSGCRILDAMSDFDLYAQGLVETPVVALDSLEPFLEANAANLWVYYCCAQGKDVSNRFFAMESARNRIMGVLLYRYGIAGFLHWGFNFYNSRLSLRAVNPFHVTDGDCAYPSGDAFLVYPGPDGTPWSSIRGEVQTEGLTDLRALKTLERRESPETVAALISRLVGDSPLTFREYPRDPAFLLNLRERLWEALELSYKA